jgi:hypothetical protein
MIQAKKMVLMLAVAASLFCSRQVCAQVIVVDSVIDCITATISGGNADSLAIFFNKRVELSLPNFAAISSRDQARMILRKFFMLHQPDSFAIAGENQYPDGFFVIGTLNSGDKRYRVSFLTKQQLSQQSVYQFSIEE